MLGHEVISTDDVIGVTGDKVGGDDMEEVITNTGDGECTQHFDAIGGRWAVGCGWLPFRLGFLSPRGPSVCCVVDGRWSRLDISNYPVKRVEQ